MGEFVGKNADGTEFKISTCPLLCQRTEAAGRGNSSEGCRQCIEAWNEAGGGKPEVPDGYFNPKPCSKGDNNAKQEDNAPKHEG